MRHVGPLAIALFAGALDRFLKILVEQPQFTAHPIGWRYFAFEQFHNPGIAFGIPIPLWVVLPLTVVFLFGIFVWAHRSHHMRIQEAVLPRIALALVVIGALSNAYDRLVHTYTIDYFRILDSIINLADLYVIVGIVLLVWLDGRRRV